MSATPPDRLVREPDPDVNRRIVELNGRPATADELSSLAVAGYAHYTSMQVRGFAVRGFDLHLHRMTTATEELFGAPLDETRVRDCLRHALDATTGDATAFVHVVAAGDGLRRGHPLEPDLLVRVSDPADPRGGRLRVRTATYTRQFPHLKNAATLGATYLTRQAALAGYDDVLFCDSAGNVSEGSIWNVALLRGDEVVFPVAEVLPGITVQVVERGLAAAGYRVTRERVPVTALDGFDAAAFMNSIDPAQAIASIDAVSFEDDTQLGELLTRAYETQPFDVL